MIEITSKLSVGTRVSWRGQLSLRYELRRKSRLRAKLESGQEVILRLPRGETLRGGDVLGTSDGGMIEVIAAPENILHVECGTSAELARAAFHLGNRHAAVQVGEGFLRVAEDHVLEEMLRGLGASVSHIEAAFEPETGAYSGAHRHIDDERVHGGHIHEYELEAADKYK